MYNKGLKNKIKFFLYKNKVQYTNSLNLSKKKKKVNIIKRNIKVNYSLSNEDELWIQRTKNKLINDNSVIRNEMIIGHASEHTRNLRKSNEFIGINEGKAWFHMMKAMKIRLQSISSYNIDIGLYDSKNDKKLQHNKIKEYEDDYLFLLKDHDYIDALKDSIEYCKEMHQFWSLNEQEAK